MFRIFIEVASHDRIGTAKQKIRDEIRERHHGIEDVTLMTQDALAHTFGGILGVLTAALGGIASVSLAVAGIGSATLFNHLYSALGHAQMQSLVKPRMRGMMSAIALFAMNIVGFGLGPLVVGYLSDAFGGGDQIRKALLVLVLTCMPWACIHYGLAARSYRNDLLRKHES